MMKQIILSQGYVALVDDSDYDFLMQWKWSYDNGYAARKIKIKKEDGKRTTKTVLMHRLIMGTPKGMDTDHEDGDRLNNQRSNLRICTKAENQHNKRIQKNNTSGYKGVFWNKTEKRWIATIAAKGKRYRLGQFVDKRKAAMVYNEAAKRLHGKFAVLNEV